MQTRKYRRTVKKGGMDKLLPPSIGKFFGSKSDKPTKKRRNKSKRDVIVDDRSVEEKEDVLLGETILKISDFMKKDKKEREAVKTEREEAEKNAKLEEAKRKAKEGNERKAIEEAKKKAKIQALKEARRKADEKARLEKALLAEKKRSQKNPESKKEEKIVENVITNNTSTKDDVFHLDNLVPLDPKTFRNTLENITAELDVSWISDENVCSHITKVFPTFATKSYEKQYCIVFLLIAMLTKAYAEFCTIVIKGGKAIQLNFSEIPYPSDDIDVIIIPKYDSVDCKIIAQEAAQFIEKATGFSILDVAAPSNIMKISYKGPEKYIALADIGYGYNELKPELREKLYKDFKTAELDRFGSINYLPSENLILEKLYYIYAYSASSPLFKMQTAEVSDNIEDSENIEYIRVTNEKIANQNSIKDSLEKYKTTKTMDDVLLNTSTDYIQQLKSANPKKIDGLIKQKHDNINDNMKGNMGKGGKIKGITVASQEIQKTIGHYMKQFALVQVEYKSQIYCISGYDNHCVDIGNNHFLEKSREQMLKLAGILSGRKDDPKVMLHQFIDNYYSVFGLKRDEMMDELIKYSILHHEWLKPAIYRKPSNGEPYLFRDWGMDK
jgi:hypothetical protein